MTRLPSVSGRECIRVLEKAGFYIKRQRGSHIIMQRDDPYANVVVPNHRTLKRGMLSSILKQADLSVDEFLALL